MLSMTEHSQPLVDAFTAVLGYAPLCQYEDETELITVEWDQEDPDLRWYELEAQDDLWNLQRLTPQT